VPFRSYRRQPLGFLQDCRHPPAIDGQIRPSAFSALRKPQRTLAIVPVNLPCASNSRIATNMCHTNCWALTGPQATEKSLCHQLAKRRNRMLTDRKVVTLFQARYNTVSWNSAHGNAANNEGGQCPSPLTGRRPIRGRIRRGVAAASFSFSPSLQASPSVVGPRCRITWTCFGSGRSVTGTCSGKR
jgi:hypothetical protein